MEKVRTEHDGARITCSILTAILPIVLLALMPHFLFSEAQISGIWVSDLFGYLCVWGLHSADNPRDFCLPPRMDGLGIPPAYPQSLSDPAGAGQPDFCFLPRDDDWKHQNVAGRMKETLPKSPISRKKTRRPFVSLSENRIKGGCRMKKWCALLMTLLLILTTAGAEEFSGGKDFWDDAYRCTVENGYLTFQSDDDTTYQPIAVRDGFAEAAKTLAAQGDTFAAAPMGLTQALLPYVADELTGGAELAEIYCTTALVGMHLRDAAKGDVLRVAWWTGDGYQMVDKVVGEDFSLDTVHVSAGEVYMEVDGQEYALKLRNGKLVLWYTAGRKIVYIQPHAIGNMEEVITMRNDSYVYGAHPFYNVEAVDFAAFPETYAEMLAQVDSTNWAVVNNPNPTDRLHLRTEPDRKSVSLGKFYNRTPVYVDEIRGEWAHVTIGRDLSGWMVTKYLAFGADMDKVKCAFPQLSLIEKYQVNVADELAYDYYVFDAPNMSATKTLWNWGEECYLIGVIDDFYIIMDTDENVRYIPQDWLWAGNG